MTSTPKTPTSVEMPLAHAGLVLALLGGGLFVPALLNWPFYLLVPLLVYFLVVLAVAPLRRSLNWVRMGRLDAAAWAVTLLVIVISSAALVLFEALERPDVSHLRARLPPAGPGTLVLVGALFAVVNALLEEAIFRGLLLDALRSSYSAGVAVAIQAIAFGVFHASGYPSGAIGVVLAALYGLMQGGLRVYADGLALCWVAHVFADATIFVLVLRHS